MIGCTNHENKSHRLKGLLKVALGKRFVYLEIFHAIIKLECFDSNSI